RIWGSAFIGPIEEFGSRNRNSDLLRHHVALPASQMQADSPGSNFNSPILAWFSQSERTSRTISHDILRADVARDTFGLAQQTLGRIRKQNPAATFFGDSD